MSSNFLHQNLLFNWGGIYICVMLMRGLYTGAEKFHAQTSRGDGGGKQKFIVKELYAVVASWQRFGPSNLV